MSVGADPELLLAVVAVLPEDLLASSPPPLLPPLLLALPLLAVVDVVVPLADAALVLGAEVVEEEEDSKDDFLLVESSSNPLRLLLFDVFDDRFGAVTGLINLFRFFPNFFLLDVVVVAVSDVVLPFLPRPLERAVVDLMVVEKGWIPNTQTCAQCPSTLFNSRTRVEPPQMSHRFCAVRLL